MSLTHAAAAAVVLSSAIMLAGVGEASAAVASPAQIRCADFKKLPDGTYESSPTAKLGSRPFGGQVVGPRGFNFGDGKLYDVIAGKCGR